MVTLSDVEQFLIVSLTDSPADLQQMSYKRCHHILNALKRIFEIGCYGLLELLPWVGRFPFLEDSVDTSSVLGPKNYINTRQYGWLCSHVGSILDSGAEGPGFKSQSGNSLRQTAHTRCASVRQAAKLVAALLRVVGVTAGLAESNGSLPPGLWLTSPAGRLPRTGISSGTLHSVIEYGLPLPFACRYHEFDVWTEMCICIDMNRRTSCRSGSWWCRRSSIRTSTRRTSTTATRGSANTRSTTTAYSLLSRFIIIIIIDVFKVA